MGKGFIVNNELIPVDPRAVAFASYAMLAAMVLTAAFFVFWCAKRVGVI
jgi:hypothetical protein